MADLTNLLKGARQSFSSQFMQGIQALEQQKQALAQREAQEAQKTDQALNRGLSIFNALDKAGADDATKQQAWRKHVSPHIDEVDKGVNDINQLRQINKILEQRQKLGAETALEAIRAINPVTGEVEEAPQPQAGLQQPEIPQPELGTMEQPEGEFVPTFKAKDIKGASEVQSSKILPGGLTQLVFRDGTVRVVPASEASKALVIQAEERGAALQGLRAGEREAGSGAIKLSTEAFKRIEPLQKNIENMEEGIRLLDEGAETGVIAKRLPSIRSASIKLANLQDRLGLDVIGNTTFGALSESELRFALDTALPTGLDGPELRNWLVEKKEAQTKLLNYLNEAAIFLGTPGNTAADFLRKRKEQRRQGQPAPTPQPAQAQTAGQIEFLGFE